MDTYTHCNSFTIYIQMLCKRHHDVWPCIRVINHAQPTCKHFTIFIQWLKIFSKDLAGRLVWFLPEERKLFAVWFRDGRAVNVLLIIMWWIRWLHFLGKCASFLMIRPGCMVKNTFVWFQKGDFLWQILIGTRGKVLCLLHARRHVDVWQFCVMGICVFVTSPSCITINPPW